MPCIRAKYQSPPENPIPNSMTAPSSRSSTDSSHSTDIHMPLLPTSFSQFQHTTHPANDTQFVLQTQMDPRTTDSILTLMNQCQSNLLAESHLAHTNHLQYHQHLIKNLNFDAIHYIATIICIQMIPYVLIYCIEECSPLVLFSWWRNKIS